MQRWLLPVGCAAVCRSRLRRVGTIAVSDNLIKFSSCAAPSLLHMMATHVFISDLFSFDVGASRLQAEQTAFVCSLTAHRWTHAWTDKQNASMSNLGYIQLSLKDPVLSVSLSCHLASIILCALILSETLALYKSFTYLLTYLRLTCDDR